MKKLFLIVLLSSLLISCADTFNNDPYIKESERIAVMEKAKTDTSTIIIKMDNHYYTVKEGEITGKAKSERDYGIFLFIGGMIGLVLGMAVGTSAAKY